MKIKLILALLLVALVASVTSAQAQTKTTVLKSRQTMPRRIVYDMSAGDTAQFTGLMRQVQKEQLLPGVTTVPMGIGELITKQDEGWGYIKF